MSFSSARSKSTNATALNPPPSLQRKSRRDQKRADPVHEARRSLLIDPNTFIEALTSFGLTGQTTSLMKQQTPVTPRRHPVCRSCAERHILRVTNTLLLLAS